ARTIKITATARAVAAGLEAPIIENLPIYVDLTYRRAKDNTTDRGVGSGEWGVGDKKVTSPIPDSPLPAPHSHSPLPAFCLPLDRRGNVYYMRSRRAASRRKITPEMVIAGYQQGYFPMARGRFGHIDWFMAEPRTVIPLDERFHVRHSLRKVIKKS